MTFFVKVSGNLKFSERVFNLKCWDCENLQLHIFFTCWNPNLFFTFWVNNCTWKMFFQRRIIRGVVVCGEGGGTYDLAARYTNWKGTICRAGCIWKISPLYGEGSLADLEKEGPIPARFRFSKHILGEFFHPKTRMASWKVVCFWIRNIHLHHSNVHWSIIPAILVYWTVLGFIFVDVCALRFHCGMPGCWTSFTTKPRGSTQVVMPMWQQLWWSQEEISDDEFERGFFTHQKNQQRWSGSDWHVMFLQYCWWRIPCTIWQY